MLDKLDAALRFQQEALNLRAQRQEVLAANIANADTPGYQGAISILPVNLKKSCNVDGMQPVWLH
ncbi:flagellar component of cell-proximal portion of basal-body rod [Escherichia coli]|nr:flagellar component of cell-proximal portion of basal-body rod [Escherichia coli]